MIFVYDIHVYMCICSFMTASWVCSQVKHNPVELFSSRVSWAWSLGPEPTCSKQQSTNEPGTGTLFHTTVIMYATTVILYATVHLMFHTIVILYATVHFMSHTIVILYAAVSRMRSVDILCMTISHVYNCLQFTICYSLVILCKNCTAVYVLCVAYNGCVHWLVKLP